MHTCEEHDDSIVVYTPKNCPVCDLVSDNVALELELEGLHVSIKEIRKELEETISKYESNP